jgi:hypothetical protein
LIDDDSGEAGFDSEQITLVRPGLGNKMPSELNRMTNAGSACDLSALVSHEGQASRITEPTCCSPIKCWATTDKPGDHLSTTVSIVMHALEMGWSWHLHVSDESADDSQEQQVPNVAGDNVNEIKQNDGME